MKKGQKTPKSVDEYLKSVPPDARKVLENLRRTIRSAAPDAVETISYRMPAFKHNGPLVYYAAFEDHLSLFPGSKSILKTLERDLKPFDTFGGTIHFSIEHPLPAALVKKIVRARMAENDSRKKRRKR